MAMPYDSSLSRTATKLLKDSQDNGAIAATRVYGQPDFTSHRCGTFGADFKGRCNGASFSLAVSQGNLYVADTGNSRVLYYPAGSTTATRVYGQPDFTARGLHPGCNTGGVSATSLCEPRDLVVDSQGNLYVEDDGNGRVLYTQRGAQRPRASMASLTSPHKDATPALATLPAPPASATNSAWLSTAKATSMWLIQATVGCSITLPPCHRPDIHPCHRPDIHPCHAQPTRGDIHPSRTSRSPCPSRAYSRTHTSTWCSQGLLALASRRRPSSRRLT